jgi:hypothetical protein
MISRLQSDKSLLALELQRIHTQNAGLRDKRDSPCEGNYDLDSANRSDPATIVDNSDCKTTSAPLFTKCVDQLQQLDK